MEELELLNKILYDFIYDMEAPYIEDFYLIDNFKSIILSNKKILVPAKYHIPMPLERSIKHSHDFLKTIDQKYADKLMDNLGNGVINFNKRKKQDTTNAQIEVDEAASKNKIIIPYSRNIEDTYTITHEQLHDTNMDSKNLNYTCSLFTEMISILGEMLQRDYLEKQTNTPKEYRKNMYDTFYAVKTYAISMDMELELIKIMFSKGFISYQDMKNLCKNKSYEELETMSIELENIFNNNELNYFKSQNYIICSILACYQHQKILDNPKKMYEFMELNELINIHPVEKIFDYLELEMRDYEFLNLTNDSYKVLKKCYNNEIKRL